MKIERRPIDLYAAQMDEIKLRVEVISYFLKGEGKAIFPATKIETICLQMRKVLELIAFGSLVANQERYAQEYEKFAKSWNAKDLLRDLERINPNFYPTPIVKKPANLPGLADELVEMDEGFLTKKDFLKLYEKFGAILHAENPYGGKIDYKYYEEKLPLWFDMVVKLLNCHHVHLYGETGFWLVHMQESGREGVNVIKFEMLPD